MRFTFKREEKLKSRKLIEKLFENGDSITEFPLRLIFLKTEHNSNFKVQASFSVSKRKFKKAVDRNRIKRLMRECYRTNKHTIYQNIKEKHIIMFTYLDEKEYKYVELEEKMINLIRKFIQKTKME
ncbi:MAG: ribonuclease P protein component [Bacteroidia bacterium]|nr:ribonuclease P protein component [Bacteroidia bacterium]